MVPCEHPAFLDALSGFSWRSEFHKPGQKASTTQDSILQKPANMFITKKSAESLAKNYHF